MAGAEEKQDGKEAKKAKVNSAQIGALVLVVANLAAMGGGGMLIYKSTIGYERQAIREEDVFQELEIERESADNAESLMYTLEPFTVNLDGSPKRVIRVEMSLEMLDKEGFEEVITLGPSTRDTIVRILNRKGFPDIETVQGKLFLKDQIAVTLNESLKKGVVKDVYFSDFLVQ